jgi:hypothetical protein
MGSEKTNILARSNTINILIMVGVILLIITSVTAIIIIKNATQNHAKKEEMLCIASKSEIYISRTCSACAYQKSILGDYVGYFNMTDCMTDTQECSEKGITHVPSWIINNTKYEGAQSIDKLKELTGC